MGQVMEIKVNISENQMEEIMKKAEDNIREELTEEAVKDYIKRCVDLDILDTLNNLGLREKYKEINEKVPIDSLNKSERMVILLYWVMYGGLEKWI